MKSKCECRVEKLNKEKKQVKYGHIKVKNTPSGQVWVIINRNQSWNVENIRDQKYIKKHR